MRKLSICWPTAIAAVDRDPSARILALRGAGKHFCAGADVSNTGDSWSMSGRTIVNVCTVLDNLSKPAVAIVQGACIGGGLALAACCDVVLATPNAFFAIPEVRLGVAPGPLTLFFMQAIPPRALRRYLISGERITAEQALSFGLVHEIAATDQIDPTFGRLIDAFLQGAPTAIADAKRILREAEPIAHGADARLRWKLISGGAAAARTHWRGWQASARNARRAGRCSGIRCRKRCRRALKSPLPHLSVDEVA